MLDEKDAQSTDKPAVVYHPSYGPALPSLNWVPAPRYLLRRDLLLNILRDLPKGKVLEMGCGAGALLNDLAKLGYTGLGVDFSTTAREIAKSMTAPCPGMSIAESADKEPDDSFDYLFAFEVLEHIELDLDALKEWSQYLKQDGTLVISVPAHPQRWNPADVWAGHFRRYTRDGLSNMVKEAGFAITDVQCYGFPLANIMERAAAGIYAKQSADAERKTLNKTGRTAESGSDRKLLTRLWPFYSVPPMTLVMRLFWKLQRLTIRSDRGIGYIVVARKL